MTLRMYNARESSTLQVGRDGETVSRNTAGFYCEDVDGLSG